MAKSAVKFWIICALLNLAASCIEPYEFSIYNKQPSLVVEAQISDASFLQTLEYPSDGRYFTVKLSYTSDVTNLKGKPVSEASVVLLSDQGEQWNYAESGKDAGSYILKDKDFEAKEGINYRIQIKLDNGEQYESSWEALPLVNEHAIGPVNFEEVEKEMYKVKAGENVLTTVKGISTSISILDVGAESPVYYKWNLNPSWIYIAPLTSLDQFDRLCWIKGLNYLNDYTLHVDNIGGGYNKELFFLEVIRNERIYEDFSVLITQEIMSEDYYFFWKELKEQVNEGALRDKPPYNLKTNIYDLKGEKRVSGFFGIVSESARRWYFNKDDLSYYVENTLKPDCLIQYGLPGEPPALMCTSCLGYPSGEAFVGKPFWWR